MQLNKKIETEVLKIYDAWMHSYLHGDVEAYNSFLDDDYHFIGSAKNEEFLNRKDTTKFFEDTGDQFAGKTEIRDETKTIEQFAELIFITHIFDGWFLNENDWTYYARFRFTSVLKNTKDGWKFIYQHFSIPDPKTEEGETIGYDKINDENQELREAITRRTFELEAKNRELEIEGALGRIRAQATAMKASTELLDIVVSMRNEFIKLGHEAHYFWHMMWLPNTYEKAMTSGDGTRIGFVMTLPRHIHGNIPLLANWEKSKDANVVYAMNTEEAIDYVDKMISLGNFQNIDPQAPSHDDIRDIGGLTFIMARTTHGEIGYSLPGIVKNPPKEDLQILERFAGAFDLAHRRFLDLQRAEQQAREVEIELALERVRSRTMAMQHSDELQEASFLLDEQVRGLGIKTWGCAFNIYGEKESTEWFGNEKGELNTYTVPRIGIFKDYYNKGQKGETLFIREFEGEECVAHYEFMSTLPAIGDVLRQLKKTNKGFPTYQIDHVVYFKYGYLLFITREAVPEAYDIFKRFAKVFEQTYTRFLDLQKAEAQAREAQIELGLERVRARAMAMQSTNELSDLVGNLLHELTKLDFSLTFCIINIINEGDKSNMVWAANPEEGKAPESYYMKFEDYPFHHAMMREWKAQTPKFIYVMEGEEKKIYDDYLYSDTEFRRFPKDIQTANRALDKYVSSFVFSKFGGLQTVGDQPLSDESLDILYRFGKVFDLTYTRFNDLQKAEKQAREAKVEAALERVRSRSLAMTKSEQLGEVILEIHKKFRELDISMESRIAIVVVLDSDSKNFNQYIASNDVGNIYISTPYFEHPILDDFYAAKEAGVEFFSKSYTEEEKNSYFKHFFDSSFTPHEIVGLQEQKKWVFDQKFYTHSQAFQKNSCIGMADYSGSPLNDFEIDTIKRFSKVFDQAYTRFLDLKKAEAQTREAQIEASLERVRSRTMAMHTTNELQDVIQTVHQELLKLEIGIHGGSFIAINHEIDKELQFWGSGGTAVTAKKFIMPYYDRPFYTDLFKGIKRGPGFFTESFSAKEKKEFFTFLMQHEPWSKLDKKEKDEVLSTPNGYVRSCCVSKHTSMVIVNHFGRDFTEDENLILKRFARVFEQTYTRFLDLQKAEEQAREAQIEAALERVRASTMAMHDSQELAVTNAIVVAQTKSLINSLFAIGIHICHNDEPFSDSWIGDPEEGQMPYLVFDHSSDPLSMIMYNEWKNGNSFHVETMEGKALMDHFKFMGTQVPNREMFEPGNLPTRLDFHFAYFSNGFLVFVTTKECPEQYSIFKRLANVFDQTYTRFLDLQKAEAQAREAQIEAALERVRSRSMAMHQSEEIGEVAKVLFQQLKSLGGELWGSGFGFCEENSEEDNFWFVTETEVSPNARIPNTTDPAHKQMYKGWKDKQDLFSIAKGGKELADHYKYMLTLPDIKPIFQSILDNGIKFPTWQKWHAAYFKYGYLLVITTEDYEDEAIFIRFAKAFEQAYTRFLDLQKAEAQAREAQIIASLERVRAATMAMHQSKELSNVLSTLFGQYDILGINPSHAVLTLINKEKNTLTFRTTGKNGYQVYAEQEVDLNLYDSWIDTTEKWKKSNPNAVNVNEYPPEVLPDVWEVYKDVVNAIPKKARPEIKDFPEGLFITEGYCQFGYIGFAHSRKPTEEEKDIVRRFAAEFGSLYQRFLDLQKAEAQAREAQIEVALEKIRSRTMAMQKGEEVKDVVVLLYKELIALGVTNFTSCGYVEINEETERQLTYVTDQGGDSLGLFYLPMKGDKVFDERYAAWKNQQAVFHQTVGGKERRKHLEYAITTFNSKEAEEMVLTQFPDPTVFYCFNFSHGYLHIVGGSRLTTEEEALMARFTRVFEQTYARFLDLKKAEIQTREAQINLAVERVRAKALAMHKSDEIMEVVAKLKDEVMGLDIPGVVAATIFLEADNNYIRMWDLSTLERSDKGYLAITDITFKLKEVDPHLYIKRVWENNENYFVEVQNSKDLNRIIEFMYENNQLEVAKEVEDYTRSTNLQQLYHASKRLNNGKLCIDLLDAPPDEMEGILNKIGAAFDLAYQRFLDLQNAEAQTKESQIEAALEKVRSRSLAMQKPDELQEVVAIVAEKLKELGVIFDAGGVILCTYFPDNKDVVHWIAVPDFSSSGRYYVPYFDNPIFNDAWDSKIRGDAYFSKEFPVEVKNHFFEHTFKHSDYRDMPEDYKQHVLEAEAHALSAAWSKNSAILIPSLTGVVPSESNAQIMKRFAKVFEQAYIRFMDLQQAEIREKEAIKQASLDRVRGEIASMRTTKDLERITPLIWKELNTLGVPFFRCGVFIIREDEKMVHAYLSKPDGTSVAALHIPFSDTDNKLITPTIENWRLQQGYKETWSQDQFIQQTHMFLEKGQIENPDAYDISETPPEQLVLHLIPFKQGMVYVGNHEDLTEDQISLVESLSSAFSVAYSRYEDFKALETAKNSLELTINDLKSTQAQLIQAEKMASLGELTAGIAHEIQNPLNFVNNFSEVSEELVDEMNEELDNGDLEEAKAISKDLKDNLSKINHHGKRADAIVKGMLEHSRINKGEKKPTDINALLDEFVRLSYHGLRAKDKSFNAAFKLDLDPNLPKVNMVSSDIGRVILNLVNNAFYACAERGRSTADKQVTSGLKTYNPEVIVSSKQTDNGIQLSVKDNGGGIPEQVRDKIFQPFFTTKPTGKGTGLGLSLSYDIIKAHGGKLTLESSEGEGTIFSIQIPIQ